MANFKIGSFNCKHFNGPFKAEYVSSLMMKCDFLCLQEHHLFESEFFKFEGLSQPSVMYTATSAMDPRTFVRGRKYGGTAILWKGNLQWTVTPIKTVSKRLAALIVTLPNDNNLLIYCVYMPCDDGCRGANLSEYQDVLGEISVICQTHNIDAFCISGDFNTDVSRNNPQTKELLNFCDRENLCLLKYDDISSVDYTFESACGARSCIDHVVVTENLMDCVGKYWSLYDVDNTSDHMPIFVEFNFDCEYLSAVRQETLNSGSHRCNWYKAKACDIAKYKSCLDSKLNRFLANSFYDVLDCCDTHCSNTEHLDCLEDLYLEIVNACLEASQQTIPNNTNKSKTVKCPVPGFTEHVKQYRNTALEWHRLWKNQGKPKQGYIAEMRKMTRSQYHYRLKAVRNQQDGIRSQRMAEALQINDHKNLWQCVRSLKKSRCLPSSVDGINNPADIAQLFNKKYETLYNSVGYDADGIACLNERIETRINPGCLQQALFDIGHVKKAVGLLKRNKHDGNIGLFSDNIIHGTDKLFAILVKLFNGMLVHGHSINDMLKGTLTPIVKDRRAKLSNSENFRSICLQNVLCKLMDLVILCKESDCLNTSDMQFGFKPKSSTSLATSMFLETTDYYVKNGGNVFALALDASKAFDRVNYLKLFKLLESRDLNPVYIRFLLDNYIKQQLRVMYNGQSSEWFNVSNGVKQGAVLSPILFSVYINDLLEEFKRNQLGCHIGNVCCGIIGYADDILLLAPTVQSLDRMINICETYANEYDIKFNSKKSQFMVFGKCRDNIDVYLNGEKLEMVSKIKYLGNVISNCINDPLMTNVKDDFVCKVNSFLANFPNVSSLVKNSLFQQYCMSLYGTNSCMLDHHNIKEVQVAWRKAIRRVWNLPYKTHRALLPHVAEQFPIDVVMYKRFVNHFISGLSHENKSVSQVFKSSLLYDSRMSKNFLYIAALLPTIVILVPQSINCSML